MATANLETVFNKAVDEELNNNTKLSTAQRVALLTLHQPFPDIRSLIELLEIEADEKFKRLLIQLIWDSEHHKSALLKEIQKPRSIHKQIILDSLDILQEVDSEKYVSTIQRLPNSISTHLPPAKIAKNDAQINSAIDTASDLKTIPINNEASTQLTSSQQLNFSLSSKIENKMNSEIVVPHSLQNPTTKKDTAKPRNFLKSIGNNLANAVLTVVRAIGNALRSAFLACFRKPDIEENSPIKISPLANTETNTEPEGMASPIRASQTSDDIAAYAGTESLLTTTIPSTPKQQQTTTIEVSTDNATDNISAEKIVVGTPSPNKIVGTPSPNQMSGTPSPNQMIGTPSPNQMTGTPSPNQSSVGTPSPNQSANTTVNESHPKPIVASPESQAQIPLADRQGINASANPHAFSYRDNHINNSQQPKTFFRIANKTGTKSTIFEISPDLLRQAYANGPRKPRRGKIDFDAENIMAQETVEVTEITEADLPITEVTTSKPITVNVPYLSPRK